MKLFKSIDWELGGMYIIREQCRFGYLDLIKVRVTRLYEKCVQFEILDPDRPYDKVPKELLLKKFQFGIFGNWEMVEEI